MVWRRNRWAVHFAKELWTDLTDQTLHARLMDALEGQHGRRMMAGVETAKLTGQSHYIFDSWLRTFHGRWRHISLEFIG
jgi:hypothetical protein